MNLVMLNNDSSCTTGPRSTLRRFDHLIDHLLNFNIIDMVFTLEATRKLAMRYALHIFSYVICQMQPVLMPAFFEPASAVPTK